MPAASSVDRFRRSLLLAAPALLLGGCNPASGTPSAEIPARILNERLAAEDEPGFLAAFAARSGAQALGARMFATLSQSPTEITATSGGRLRVGWSIPGEPRVNSEAAVDLIDGRIANLTPTTSGTEWLGSPLGSHSSRTLVVAAGTAGHLSRWSSAAESGMAALARVVPHDRQWAEPVVVLVPDSMTGFAAYAGRSANETAAVTVVPGLPDSAGVRIVVNPTHAQKSADDRALIAHETVHAWMRSPWLTGTPGWLLEGIAEAFTAAAYPTVAARNRELAKTAARHTPSTLPAVDQGGESAYALAQVAVDAMVRHLGWAAVLDEAEARTSGGRTTPDATVLAWYREALDDLD
ncbi:MAG: hypothetical protein QM582_05070 [Micropruina sp.]|uniref:hypothetical protein n=1 Tax=Micropruina sp. TaxID=2737536 RepID=UPI0039E6EF16